MMTRLHKVTKQAVTRKTGKIVVPGGFNHQAHDRAHDTTFLETAASDASGGTSSGLPLDTGTLELFDDLYPAGGSGVYLHVIASSSGSGSAATQQSPIAAIAGHPGVLRLETGTTTTGRAWISLGASDVDTWWFGTNIQTVTWLIRTGPNLSDATDTYSLRIGLHDNIATPASIADGAFFLYSHGTNSGRWEANVFGASSSTVADTGITVAADTWYKLSVTIDEVGGSAAFSINDDLVATIEGANVPTGTGEGTAISANINKSAGTTERLFYVDYVYFAETLASTRLPS